MNKTPLIITAEDDMNDLYMKHPGEHGASVLEKRRRHLPLPATSLDSNWHLSLTGPSDSLEENAKLGDTQTQVTLLCLDL